MKRIFVFFMLLFLSGCGAASNDISPLDSVKTYKDIPGVTADEIAAIEALKANRDKFLYGSLFGTEAFILPDGSHAGYATKFCGLLSNLFEVEFVTEIYDWDELISKLEDLSLDFTGDLTPSQERQQRYYMTSPIAERLLRIFTHKRSDIAQGSNINRLKIGFLEGAITADNIKNVYSLSFTHVDVENYQMAAEMLASGEIDAFIAESVADSFFADYDFIQSMNFFPIIYEPVSMATANPELAPIISVISKYINAGGYNKLYELYIEGDFEYTKYKLSRTFTSEENDYLEGLARRGESVAVAFEHDNYPVSFYNKNEKEFQGIAVEVLAEIGKLTGIEFDRANTENEPWSVVYEMLKTGEVSIVSQLIQTEERKGNFLWPDTPYTTTRYVFISKLNYPDRPINLALRKKIGVVRGTAYEEKYVEWFQDSENLIRYDTQNEALLALEGGEIDLLMGSKYLLLAQQNYREKPGYKANIHLDTPTHSYFGINKDEAVLRSIISKAQDYIRTDRIASDWENRGFDYEKKLAEHRAFYLMTFIAILSIVLIMTVSLLFRNVRLSKKLKELAGTDALTGVLNRRCFMELCTPQIDRSLRAGNECFIIIFDLDHFKSVNDTYGHLGGDKVLKEIAQRLKRAIRPYDLFARYGGEEFIIFMPDIDKANALKAAERLRQCVCQTPVEFEGRQIPVTSSFGVAYAAPVNDIEKATRCADEALYNAKNAGRNRVVFYGEKGVGGPRLS
ncbi:MAG: GGDEF domain-containing protein [Deltaproteobacteria bacterium]|nr:GGDEF domain-containing protein [Deltaproteobacteria bacterium]